jgi:hypothetical protein
MVNRILAVLAALAMIGGAVAWRSSRDSSPVDSGDGFPSSGANGGSIVCAQELGDACDALPEGRVVEPAGETADRLLKARDANEAGVAVWLAPGPWADMVDAGRAGQARLFAKRTVLARTPLVAVLRKGELPSGCVAPVTWKCLGDAAQAPTFRIGADQSPATSGFLRAAAVAGFLGASTYATNDLDGAAADWLANLDRRLAAAPGFGAPSVAQFLINQGSAQAFLTTEAAARAANAPPSTVGAPQPLAAIGAVLARTKLSSRPIDEAAVTKALGDAHWQPGPAPSSEGLPSPGVLLAMRETS